MVVNATRSSTGSRYYLHQFKTLFGVSPNIMAMTREYMLADSNTVHKEVALQDLLKALHFLKCYSTETQSCKLFN